MDKFYRLEELKNIICPDLQFDIYLRSAIDHSLKPARLDYNLESVTFTNPVRVYATFQEVRAVLLNEKAEFLMPPLLNKNLGDQNELVATIKSFIHEYYNYYDGFYVCGEKK